MYNQEIIYSGVVRFVAKHDSSKSIDATGDLTFEWFPKIGAVFKGRIPGYPNVHPPTVMEAQHLELWANGLMVSDVQITLIRHPLMPLPGEPLVKHWYIEASCDNKTIMGDSSIQVQKLEFVVPNLRSLTNEYHIEQEFGYSFVHLIVFRDNEVEVRIQEMYDFDQKMSQLNSNGGYAATYFGEASKTNSKTFSLREERELMEKLATFFSFLNGRRTTPIFIQGKSEGVVYWTDYSHSVADSYIPIDSWQVLNFPNRYEAIWENFVHLWEDESERTFMKFILHWYFESLKSQEFSESGIINAQTGIESLYHKIIVQQKKLLYGKDIESIAASNKIRLILSILNAPSDAPEFFDLILKKIGQEFPDAPAVCVKVRNSLVHSGKASSRDDVETSKRLKIQVLTVLTWYLEMGILYYFGFEGKYWNRSRQTLQSQYDGEIVPWSTRLK
ncbi:hypothetical protein [Dyadobacter arcticus]|uniref:YopA central domain-containing protein n=1 Tax=Dyadobacter arcticus TaxID=1078754 RepID=A0ABX0UHE3_9BACT|nr:hypothetical protein [Dyadobacter arcticus]NIJ52443.1 hypothetical protein [Dyadobacter arcticus]